MLCCSCFNVVITEIDGHSAKVVDGKILFSDRAANMMQLEVPSHSSLTTFRDPIVQSSYSQESFANGLQIKYPSLLIHEPRGVWIDFKCVNCSVYTHSTLSTDGNFHRVINRGALLDAGAQADRKANQNYNQTLDLMCYPSDGHHLSVSRSPALDSAERQDLNTVLERCNDELVKQQRLIAHKIEMFRKDQEESLEKFQVKMTSERDSISSKIREAHEIRSKQQRDQVDKTEPLSQLASSSPSLPVYTSEDELDERDLFDVEESGGNDSQTDTVEGDDSVPAYKSRFEPTSRTDYMAQSVPVTIPFSSNRLHQETDSGEPTPDFQDMGASIQALAKSVGVDSSKNLFGELPRARHKSFRETQITKH